MPDIPDRDKLERKIARLLGKLNQKQKEQLLELMGNSPSLAKIPPDFWTSSQQELAAELMPFSESVYMAAAGRVLETVPIGVDWALVNQDAVDWASRYVGQLVKDITKTTERSVGQAVSSFFSEEQTIGDLEKRLSRMKDRFGNIFGPVRAEMIAVTETTRAAAQGELAVASRLKGEGIEMRKVWQTNKDELVCPICNPLQGAEEREWSATAPDGPPAHPRCRCFLSLLLPKPAGEEFEKPKEEEKPELVINTYPEDRLWKTERNPTEAEIGYMTDIVNGLPPDLQKLRPMNDEIFLTIEEGRAESRNNRIMLDEKYMNPGSQVAKHEYFHTMINNNKTISDNILDKYNPPMLFKHTDIYGRDWESAYGENIVMILSAHDTNRDSWISQVKEIEKWKRVQTIQEATQQVEAVEKFFRAINLW